LKHSTKGAWHQLTDSAAVSPTRKVLAVATDPPELMRLVNRPMAVKLLAGDAIEADVPREVTGHAHKTDGCFSASAQTGTTINGIHTNEPRKQGNSAIFVAAGQGVVSKRNKPINDCFILRPALTTIHRYEQNRHLREIIVTPVRRKKVPKPCWIDGMAWFWLYL
jgi:hypothetical protein